MKRLGYRYCLGLCGLVLSCSAAAQDAKWGPHIDFEAKPGSKRNLGEADLFLPLAQDSRTLLFANLRTRFDNRDGYEGNLGLGVRRMLENGWNLGAYAYADRRRTQLRNTFDQATFGVEALGRDFELRANGYLPFGSRARELAPVSNASISGASVQVSTDFREERALKGYDAEVGWRTPLFDSEATRQLRVYLGGYRFADAGISVHGPRLRAEFAVQELPWFGGRASVFVGAETQRDSARGTQNFAYVRLRIPLEKDSARMPRLNAQERRMTAPVVRDVDIVTQSRTRATISETATVTAGGQAITILSSGTTTGAALPGAVAAAGANSTVILTGSYTTTASTVLQAGQTLMGAGPLAVRTPSGFVATLNAPGATIHGNDVPGSLGTITMANNSTLRGMTINDTGTGAGNSLGLLTDGVSGAVVVGNTITANGAPADAVHGISFLNSSNITVSGNTITANGGGNALALQYFNTSGIISNNTLSASGSSGTNRAVLLVGGGGATALQAGSTGNNRVAGTCSTSGTVTGAVGFTNGTTCP